MCWPSGKVRGSVGVCVVRVWVQVRVGVGHPHGSPSALTLSPHPSPSGKARHLGVSNFNTHDLAMLLTTAEEPIDVLEAHFGVGLMDFEVRGMCMHMHMLRACPL